MPEVDSPAHRIGSGQGSSSNTGTSAKPGASSSSTEHWASAAADRVVSTVDNLARHSTVRVDKMVRLVIYGLVVLVAAAAFAVFCGLAAFRAWVAYIPIDPIARRVWLAYVILGGLFLLGSLFAWHKRSRQTA